MPVSASWLALALSVAAVWRLTHLLHTEDGPWGVLARLRAWAERVGLAGVFQCFYCLSMWTALPFACWLGEGWAERATFWLALSAGAILIEMRIFSPP